MTMGQSNPYSSAVGGETSAADRSAAQKLAGQASSAADTIGDQASEMADSAKEYLARGGEALMDKVNEQKGAGAEYVSGVADTLRSVAGEFDRQLPFAATYIRSAASQVDSVAEGIRSGDVSQLVRRAQTFAREQPTLVAGVAMLAGFGLVRLIRNADVGGAQTAQSGATQSGSATQPMAGGSQRR